MPPHPRETGRLRGANQELPEQRRHSTPCGMHLIKCQVQVESSVLRRDRVELQTLISVKRGAWK